MRFEVAGFLHAKDKSITDTYRELAIPIPYKVSSPVEKNLEFDRQGQTCCKFCSRRIHCLLRGAL